MKRLILAAALASVAGTGVAIAQNPAAPASAEANAPRHHGKHHGPRGMMRADANKDGAVTRAEATAAADARFARTDANKDGRVTAEERAASRSARWGGKAMTRPAPVGAEASRAMTRDDLRTRALARFDRIDANKDGRIDAAEMKTMRGHRGGHRRGMGGMMMMADTNRDGVLTQAEMTAGAQAMFQQVDVNKDGRVTREELGAMKGPRGTERGPNGMQRPPIPGDPR